MTPFNIYLNIWLNKFTWYQWNYFSAAACDVCTADKEFMKLRKRKKIINISRSKSTLKMWKRRKKKIDYLWRRGGTLHRTKATLTTHNIHKQCWFIKFSTLIFPSCRWITSPFFPSKQWKFVEFQVFPASFECWDCVKKGELWMRIANRHENIWFINSFCELAWAKV